MQRHARSLLSSFPIAVLVLSAAGCQCKKGGPIGDSFAVLGVVWTDTDSTVRTDRNATYDFGTALVGDTVAKPMTVKNEGNSDLKLTGLTQASGVTTTIGDQVVADSYYTVKFTPPVTVTPSASVTFDMTFTPQVGDKNPVSVLTMTAEGTRDEDSTATITLKGVGQGGVCDLPDTLDFGDVPTGEHFKLKWTFQNPAAIVATAHVGDIYGSDAMSFVADQNGDVMLPAMSNTDVNFTFSPTEIRPYEAKVKMKGPGDCPEGEVTLKGNGADNVLTWTPISIDYGYVSPSVSAPRDVVFTNTSNVPITLTNITNNLPTDFQYLNPATDTATTLTIAGGGQTHMTIACRPASLGARSATLTFDTGLAKIPHGSIDLKCYGGGPSIVVTPRPTLNFGKVALFPGNTSYFVTRKITVENVGSKPPNNDVSANLWLGMVDPINGPGQTPRWDITPGASTLPGEFDITLPSSYNIATGLPAVIGQNFADLTVVLQPQSIGMKSATVVIHSNDPVEPNITVTLTADVESLPPCQLDVTPSKLDFGLVTPPDQKDLGVVLTNLGKGADDTCYLSGLELAAGSDPAFSIVGGNIDEKELQPGEVMNVVVRVWPMGAVPATTQTLTGALHFNVASPTNPQVVVPVQASIGPVCLTVVPGSFDYGNVMKGCNTAPQQFTVYNTCAADVFIQTITMSAAGGFPAGSANCPGAAPCPEFSLTSTPVIPGGGLRMAAGDIQTFSAKYHPLDYGADSGAIAIAAVQGGQNVTYLVSLQGLGDMTGQQTDTFVQDAKPKADVLLIIDDSCSMSDKQNALASNFTSFIQYASSTNADWQMGVTTTDAAPPDCSLGFCQPGGTVMGKLVGDASNPKILTPATPNVQAKFQAKVIVGTNGGTETGLEAAVDALTPPLITNENAGFLRFDANLAIVVVSDAGDQGGKPYATYLNRLRNVKGYQRSNLFTFSDIGPYLNLGSNGCTTISGNQCCYDDYVDSQTYAQMVTDTLGVKGEICQNNWAATLQNLGKTAFGYRTTFFLTAAPDLTMGRVIGVTIDGTAVPPANWTFNATTLSIDFDPMHTPGPGQTLTVTYFRECL